MTAIFGIVMMQLCMHADMHVWIVLAAGLFGFFGLATYGTGLRLVEFFIGSANTIQ